MPESILLLISFILGVSLGSFVCVLSDRLPRGEQVAAGRSKCEKCHKTLSVMDLIPVVSYIYLGGKCRYCHSKIPIHVLLVEFSAGLIAVGLAFYALYLGLDLFHYTLLLIIFLAFLGIFVADYIYGIIPDEYLIVILFSALVLIGLYAPAKFLPNLISGICALLLFLALFLITRGRGMGFGDVKLSFVLGIFLGFPLIIINMYFAFLTATAISLILILIGRKKLRGGTIAFGPYLVAGAAFAYFLGDSIWSFIF